MALPVSVVKSAAIHVFVQFYRPRDESRRREIETCLSKNIANPHIDFMHVWVEDPDSLAAIPSSGRVKAAVMPRRVTYADWLEATNALPPGDISLLVNADIVLDETLGLLRAHAPRMQTDRVFLALTRYNLQGEHWVLNKNPQWTQDTWGISRGDGVFSGSLLQEASIQLGKPGCDNKIAYVMHSYGFTVSNPCRQLLTYHLHAQDTREYDKVEDRLLGLYAFVNPVSVIGSASALEFQLLTRALRDPAHIIVANWFNQRADQVLSNTSQNLPATQDGFPWGASRRDAQKGDPRFFPQVPRAYVPPPQDSALEIIESFSSRYCCVSDKKYLYFLDVGWPLCARILLTDRPPQFDSWPIHRRFAFGFLPPLFGLEPFVPAIGHLQETSGIFWQYPCRTEQMASGIVGAQQGYLTEDGVYEIYVGLPWATFYDRTLVTPPELEESDTASAVIDVLAARLQALRGYLATQGHSLRLHTVCQHILWEKCLPWFNSLGVTDLWISHKQGGRNRVGAIRLHAWHLHAVNVLELARQTGLSYKPVAEKSLLASFVGAHMSHYLSEIRLRLKEFLAANDIHIAINEQWHFNRTVYECQVIGERADQNEAEAGAMASYNRVLSDSRFSLCPAGSGPNTLRLWESLAIGSVPVVLCDTHELPALSVVGPEIGITWDDVLLRYPEELVDGLEAHLRAIPEKTIARMQRAGLKMFEAVQCFSPVGAERYFSSVSEEDLIWFKPQQLHVAKGMQADVTGHATRLPVWLPDDATELTIHFDKPEELLGLRVIRTGNETGKIKLSLDLAQEYGYFVHAVDVRVEPGSQWVMIPQTGTDLPLMAETVRLRRSSDAQNVLLRVEFRVRRDALALDLREGDSKGFLYEACENPTLRALNPFDAQNLENGEIIRILRSYAAQREPPQERSFFPPYPAPQCNLLGARVQGGISLVISLMNRNALVEQNLSNWLNQSIDELILVDWSSDEPVATIPGIFSDPRVRVLRVPGQSRFVRTWAQNLGIRSARHSRIMKCDADVSFHGDFFHAHPLSERQFWVGEWRQARDWNERHLTGNIYLNRDDFYRINGYDERILTYGHDDTDISWRLIIAGCRKEVFAFTMMHHQPHGNRARIERLETFIHPEVLTRYQRLMAAERPLWSSGVGSCFRILQVSGHEQQYQIEIASDFEPPHSPELLSEARRTVAGWYLNDSSVNHLSESQIDEILAAHLG